MSDPRATDDLNDRKAWPFGEDGVDEIVIRVSRWEDPAAVPGEPACFQVLVKGRDRTRVWGVGIGPNPVASLQRAITEWFTRADPHWSDGQPHGMTREPLVEENTVESVREILKGAQDPETDIEDHEMEDLLVFAT